MSSRIGAFTLCTANQPINSHKSIIAYLSSTKLSSSAAALREELGIGDSFDDVTSKKYEGLLEKKWTSVVRLQKKVTATSFWKFAPG